MNTIYTIGHSNHEAKHFLSLLAAHDVKAIIDVRSNPFSRFVPHFSKARLQTWLSDAGIDYVFLGRELGARRDEDSCYVDGQARYERISQLPLFCAGLKRVLNESEERRVALMCSESDPLSCHRTILVCRELLRHSPNLRMSHILPNASAEAHEEAMLRLVALHRLQVELFDGFSTQAGLAEHAQDLQASRIAYCRVG